MHFGSDCDNGPPALVKAVLAVNKSQN
jgi:hypothetical protein